MASIGIDNQLPAGVKLNKLREKLTNSMLPLLSVSVSLTHCFLLYQMTSSSFLTMRFLGTRWYYSKRNFTLEAQVAEIWRCLYEFSHPCC